jgi:hypothetical protein
MSAGITATTPICCSFPHPKQPKLSAKEIYKIIGENGKNNEEFTKLINKTN